MDEDLKLSADFKRAYNHADMIITQMPHIIDGMTPAKDESSEYTRGFNARLSLYNMERDAVKDLSRKNLLSKYGKRSKNYEKDSDPKKQHGDHPTKD